MVGLSGSSSPNRRPHKVKTLVDRAAKRNVRYWAAVAHYWYLKEGQRATNLDIAALEIPLLILGKTDRLVSQRLRSTRWMKEFESFL